MDGEDVVMGDAGGPVILAFDPRASNAAVQNGQVQNGQGHANAPSLMQSFREKVIEPGKLVEEVEAHQKGLESAGLKNGEASNSSMQEQGTKIEAREDSDMETDLDWDRSMEATARNSRLLPRASLPTGLCYDVRMRYHCEIQPSTDVHPEDPRRIYYIHRELCKAGLVDHPSSTRPLVDQPLLDIPAREATKDEISLIHARDHYDFVKSTQGKFLLNLKYATWANTERRYG